MFFLYFLCLLALVMKTTDLAIPKGQKCEIVNLVFRAKKSSEKWVRSREMSQISW